MHDTHSHIHTHTQTHTQARTHARTHTNINTQSLCTTLTAAPHTNTNIYNEKCKQVHGNAAFSSKLHYHLFFHLGMHQQINNSAVSSHFTFCPLHPDCSRCLCYMLNQTALACLLFGGEVEEINVSMLPSLQPALSHRRFLP